MTDSDLITDSMGPSALIMRKRGMLYNDGVYVGIVSSNKQNTARAQEDLIPISTLSQMEGCGPEDRCWLMLFTTQDIESSHSMCCNIAAHGAHMQSSFHNFKTTTFQYVRQFRINHGMATLPRMLADGTTIPNQKGGKGKGKAAHGAHQQDGSFFSSGRGRGPKGSHAGPGKGKSGRGNAVKRKAEDTDGGKAVKE